MQFNVAFTVKHYARIRIRLKVSAPEVSSVAPFRLIKLSTVKFVCPYEFPLTVRKVRWLVVLYFILVHILAP